MEPDYSESEGLVYPNIETDMEIIRVMVSLVM